MAAAVTLPHGTLLKASRVDLESSGGGPTEPVQGVVKVVQLDPRGLSQMGIFRRGLTPRRAAFHGPRLPFPAFLSHGRPGPAMAPKAPAALQHNLHPETPSEMQRKKIGVQMWQKAIDKGAKKATALPVNLKDTKQTCTAVPFTQHVTADGCETVAVHNRLCFGQCSSLFVPSEGEFAEASPVAGAFQRRAPCSRCAPFRAHTATVPLRCGAQVRLKRVMVVEECKCETGREERERTALAAAADTHL
ncbi:DAN domain family member 5 [Salarias fasciatus]|nr:DAN domain family member 5-like [Salarias fasciatus]